MNHKYFQSQEINRNLNQWQQAVIGLGSSLLSQIGRDNGSTPGVSGGTGVNWGQIAGIAGQALGAVGTRMRGRGRASSMKYNPRTGQYDIPIYRHRGRGLSARDIKGAARVATVVKKFGYKPKFSPRKKRR